MDNSVRTFYQPHKYEHIEHGFGKVAPHNSVASPLATVGVLTNAE